jgi:hypothetical protein
MPARNKTLHFLGFEVRRSYVATLLATLALRAALGALAFADRVRVLELEAHALTARVSLLERAK